MNRATVALLCVLVVLAGCASSSSSSSRASSSNPPRVRCLTDPGRDNASSSRPLFFLFCTESP